MATSATIIDFPRAKAQPAAPAEVRADRWSAGRMLLLAGVLAIGMWSMFLTAIYWIL